MTTEFNKLCENLNTIVVRQQLRYPRQIELSEEFRTALNQEINRFGTLQEDQEEPIRNFDQKFLKALRFEVVNTLKKLNH